MSSVGAPGGWEAYKVTGLSTKNRCAPGRKLIGTTGAVWRRHSVGSGWDLPCWSWVAHY